MIMTFVQLALNRLQNVKENHAKWSTLSYLVPCCSNLHLNPHCSRQDTISVVTDSESATESADSS